MNKELAKTIGAAARQARKHLQLTQEDVAERIDVSVEFYARIERGTSLPSILTFVRVVAALGISADLLLGQQFAAPPAAASWMPISSADSADVRRVVRRIRKAKPSTLRLVNLLLKELERNGDADVPVVRESKKSAKSDSSDAKQAVEAAPAVAADEAHAEGDAAAATGADEQPISASKALGDQSQAPGMRSISSPRRVYAYGATATTKTTGDVVTH